MKEERGSLGTDFIKIEPGIKVHWNIPIQVLGYVLENFDYNKLYE
jgi:hypothetical protein